MTNTQTIDNSREVEIKVAMNLSETEKELLIGEAFSHNVDRLKDTDYRTEEALRKGEFSFSTISSS